MDYVFGLDEIDQRIEEMLAKGTLTPRKGPDAGELINPWKEISSLFADENVNDWLSGKYRNSDDPLAARTAKTIDKKAPLALKFANQIVDAGYSKPLKEGLNEELAHLYEIFSTKDALIGLTNIGKENIPFEGK